MRHNIIDIFLTTMLCYPLSTDTWYHYLGGTYMFNHRRAYPLLTISFIILFLLSACGSNSPQSGSSSNGSSSSTAINVVAAENFYGDITKQLGGAHGAFTFSLSNPNFDPHYYESNCRTPETSRKP